MKTIKISKELSRTNSNISLLCLSYQVEVTNDCKDLWEYINSNVIPTVESTYSLENLTEQKEIKLGRETYRALGKAPSRYRISSEALIRRILQGKGLYKVNNVVDCNNLISIETGLSCGSYDLSKLTDNLEFRIGKAGESYKGIGKEEINIENLPVFADNNGAYGSPTSDSERAMITTDTKSVMTVMMSFSGAEVLEQNLEKVKKYLQEFLGATNIEDVIVVGEIVATKVKAKTESKKQKFVEAITSRDDDFAQWYTDIVKKAELIDYSSVRGCMILKPSGYALWENIQAELDRRFKETGHENVYMPLFIPESLLNKEKDHVEGFAPEVAWVTHGGSNKLEERLCVRPTSETLFCELYNKIVKSYRDLPKLYNQWCSVVRWEKTTRPFLRSMEFLWQEGHTAHETEEQAREETIKMLNVYADFHREFLAIPVITGQKTDKEKFAGAVDTYTIEALMYDGKALQAGTSHYFGDGFAKAFDIQYTDRENKQQYVHQTSWGMTTRLIGEVIMVHADDNGLVLPPYLAPTQAVIIPIASNKEGVSEKCNEVYNSLKDKIRVKLDDSDNSPGFKFAEHEMRGVPIRIEIGPRDIENGVATVSIRHNYEKIQIPLDELSEKLPELLNQIHTDMYNKALDRLTISPAKTLDELVDIAENKKGFVEAMWCGSVECEEKIKEHGGITSRCIPFEQKAISDTCICCGKPAEKLVYWGKAY